MTPRLTTAMLVSALIRRAESEGGFATVLAKGDPGAGAIAILLLEKGRKAGILERMLQPDGSYAWARTSQSLENEEDFTNFLARRRKIDPDLWVLELDIASAERFAAEINPIG